MDALGVADVRVSGGKIQRDHEPVDRIQHREKPPRTEHLEGHSGEPGIAH